ncbi:MAG: hypothetical protein ACD_75C01779G0001 [uncultured bacterium]|nr:MAG: hypothetical protein ACD_75C01779G0001 [uncultured bacterium]
MQPAAFPEFAALLFVLEVALGQPWSANNHFASRLAVMDDRLAVRVDDLQLDVADRQTGAAADGDLAVLVPLMHIGFEAGDGQDRTGFRHAVTGEDIDAVG